MNWGKKNSMICFQGVSYVCLFSVMAKASCVFIFNHEEHESHEE